MDIFEDEDLYTVTVVGDVRDPYPEFARMRAESPVAVVQPFGEPVYQMFRYEDVNRAVRDPETFSSRLYGPVMGVVMGPSILQMDGTEHHSHRGLIGGAFRRTILTDWEASFIQPTVHALIDSFASAGRAELVRHLCVHYPIQVIAKMLGVPVEDYRTFARLSIELISIAVDFERGMAASNSLKEYLGRIVAERRAEPRDDLISTLVQSEIDGHPLPDEEIYGFLRLLLPAGAETSQRLLGTLLLALLTHPEQLEAARADRKLIANAIEEALRWEAPVQQISREATRDVEVAGVLIPEGSHVSMSLGSANHDERVFDDPEAFDLFRDGPPHLAFAEGPHRCLGEHLARLEVLVAVNALLDRLPDMRLDPGDRDPHVHGQAFRSPNCVPVAFTPA
ncbi:MAG: cytochrome P450 [Actinomycetota bacterium]